MPKITVKTETLPYEINEEIKTRRTNIVLSGADKKVILMTSAISGEGKSTTSINLARSFAEMGKKTLLIDGDLRKSHMKDVLANGEKVELGLAHLLGGQCSLPDVLCSSATDKVDYVFAGAYPPNPSELLAGSRMQSLLTAARKYYDYIILDMSPIGMVADSAVVAPYCDGMVLVIESAVVKYRMAQECNNKQIGRAHV